MAYLFSFLLILCGYNVSSLSSKSLSALAIRSGLASRGGVREGTDRTHRVSLLVRNALKGIGTEKEKTKRTAVVIGAGPAGLAAALVLSNLKVATQKDNEEVFFDRVVVLEDAPKEVYDPARAYFYNVNKRGQRFTNAFDIDLAKRGLGVTEFAKLVVPADPIDVFDENIVPKRQSLSEKEKAQMGTMYWIPRQELIEVMTDEILARNKRKVNGATKIEFRRGVRCTHVEPTEEGLVRIVTEGTDECLVADLCVGADGISSKVRQSLEDGRFDPKDWSNAKNPSRRFRLKKYFSPSFGLRIKGLRIKPHFAIPKGGTNPDDVKAKIPIIDGFTYSLTSATQGPTDRLNLIFLPQKNPDAAGGRSVNICTLPDHDLWDGNKVQANDGGRSAKAYFTKAFPRFDWDEIVDEKEWEIFASTEGSSFPPCQYSPSMYVSRNSESGGSGVVLIGDALHSFPPDLGQGVNSALCDVMLLKQCFEDMASTMGEETSTNMDGRSYLPETLKLYEKKNGPETRSLIQLARFGAPFQYEQSSPMMRFRKKLWMGNVIVRLLLNKITLGVSPKPAILMMMDSQNSFRKIMRKANALTMIIWSFVSLFFYSLIRARVGL